MSDCARFEQRLYEGETHPEILDHLTGCANCSALHRRLELISSHLKFDIELNPHYELFRKDIIRQKTSYVSQVAEPSNFAFRLARVAILVVASAIVFVSLRANKPEPPSVTKTVAAPQRTLEFEMQKVNDELIKLSWKGNSSNSYRVYKGPTPGHLNMVQQVRGTEWIDQAPDSYPIVFYKIESF